MSVENSGPGNKVSWIEINKEHEGQRIDNFLISLLKGVPKSRIYRIVRKGEVRINKGRCNAKQRLECGDIVRIPPVRIAERTTQIYVPAVLQNALQNDILYEDDFMLILNKPAGFAVHGGSGINSGIIEGLRQLRPENRYLELVHRLDRDTSGCLLIAKKSSMLRKLHELFRTNAVTKSYLCLLTGRWARKKQRVNAPLLKNIQKGGERVVVVNKAGKPAETNFRRLQLFKDATMVKASPKTGRTHQIRVHAAWLGHPIIGDPRYGAADVNLLFRKKGCKRMFLHAEDLQFEHPEKGEVLIISAPLPKELEIFLNREKKL